MLKVITWEHNLAVFMAGRGFVLMKLNQKGHKRNKQQRLASRETSQNLIRGIGTSRKVLSKWSVAGNLASKPEKKNMY
jgi:hypothetical protein